MLSDLRKIGLIIGIFIILGVGLLARHESKATDDATADMQERIGTETKTYNVTIWEVR